MDARTAARISGIFHKTSVDATKTAQTTISHVGQKRTFDEYHEKSEASAQSAVGDVAKKSEFRRPTLHRCLDPLKASVIHTRLQTHGPTEYSQRRHLALTPAPTSNPYLSLSHRAYGLPKQLVDNLASLGVRSIYPWQSDCLLKSGALDGEQNLVYTAPTGGGKSLVADVLMIKKIVENPGKKAILVLPYVALVQEKLRWLRQVVSGITKKVAEKPYPEKQNPMWSKRGDEESVRVVGFFGGSKSNLAWADLDIAVCTIERANLLINAAIGDWSVGNLAVVVMDELHMLDDEGRGYILELMATKLLCLDQSVQIIGMSATLNNAELLAKWLDNARFYISRYRPVPVEEYLVFDNNVYNASSSSSFYKTATQLNLQSQRTQVSSQMRPEATRVIVPSEHPEFGSSLVNAVVSLAYETASAGYGALVFCSSRVGCETDAQLISRVMPRPEELNIDIVDKREELLSDLRSLTIGLDSVLEKTIPVGVAFHHAGLTTEERDLVAAAYDEGVLKVIVATCSLAAGINLPARRVILHGARMGADLVGPSMLRQMRGRAGRKGKDEIGETYLCCQKSDLEAVAELMEADIPSVESCLVPGKRGIKRALLEVIVTQLATSDESIDNYIKKTLLYQTSDRNELSATIRSTLDDLIETDLVSSPMDGVYEATLIGQAVVASLLAPEDGLFVHKELKRALEAFVLDGDMHAFYTFTPVQVTTSKVNWKIFLKEIDHLSESNLRVLTFLGLNPLTINKMANGATLKETTLAEINLARIYKRFYTALQLRDLSNEMPISQVARKYDLPRGIIQNLAQTCHGFAAGMVRFCGTMGWGALAAVLGHYEERLKAGAKSDLLALAEITYVKSRTARIFWENGFKTVAAVAAADVKDLLPVLIMAQPKKPRLDAESEEKYIRKLKAKVEIILKSAGRIWERQVREEIEDEE
ncbi:P-loop containing nucleoside triphosphate hydrolase [Glarea lozoyensis ATCC 20868]|uniref:p-loop containing nucleoside triphosphate hydrolase n=1 Tax=Glarea lozoyensis (strain ATCC 20868 / MF5171) TaxID=1116229 RepID=S3EAZ0_GLAL2|nr:P-loop containing nucleoside triphosphate hydrolase [Glarea lozoyensis ATCC 20868]EPE35493.1 P-loop containing nucleoside triphosphate hydrolase [Glarea lozoyensis ATCC 20868]